MLHACVIGASQQRRNVRGGAAASQCDHLETCRVLLAQFEVLRRSRPISLSLATPNQNQSQNQSPREASNSNEASSNGSEPSKASPSGAQPSLFINVAAENSDATTNRSLFELNYADANGNTALHYASGLGQAAIVELLLRSCSQSHVNAVNTRGKTPLHAAFHYILFKDLSLDSLSQLRIAKALLEAGADFRANDADGRSPLEVAKANMDAIYVRELVDFLRERMASKSTPPSTPQQQSKVQFY